MKCLICGTPLEGTYVCPRCGRTDEVARKIIYSSNWHYNQGLARANIRDLSGAAQSLIRSLQYNKRNTRARNLLGLIYFQMGEIVDAISQWVISVNFQPESNPARDYINTIQENQALFQEASKVIKKYNTALDYLSEGNEDMAILELKKAVSLNPKYVRAYQLLALLFIRREQYAAARKMLTRAVKVDRNNVTTMKYLKEVNQHYKKPVRSKTAPLVRVSDPTPIVIEKKPEGRYREYNTGFVSFINILIGLVVGAAVVWLLIVPSMTKGKEKDYNDAVISYSAELSERNKKVDSLETQIKTLKKTISDYESKVGTTVNDDGQSRKNLEKAIVEFLDDNYSAAGKAVAEIDPDAISDDNEKKIYKALKEATKDSITPTLYANAEADYENGDYTKAVNGFSKVLRMDSTYTSAIYYLARSYHRAGDLVNAALYYQQIVDDYSDSEYYTDAKQYLDQIGSTSSGASAAKAAEKKNSEAEKAKAQTETETETSADEGNSDDGSGSDGNYDDGSGDDGGYDDGSYDDGSGDEGNYDDGSDGGY